MKLMFVIATLPDGTPIAFNIEHIKYVLGGNGGSIVMTRDTDPISVTETVEEFINTVNDI